MDTIFPDELLVLIMSAIAKESLADLLNFSRTCKRFSDILKSEQARIFRSLEVVRTVARDDRNECVASFRHTATRKWQHGGSYAKYDDVLYFGNFRRNKLTGPMITFRQPCPNSEFELVMVRNWQDGLLHGIQMLALDIHPDDRYVLDQRDAWRRALTGKTRPVRFLLRYEAGSLVEYVTSVNPDTLTNESLIKARSLVEGYGEEFDFRQFVKFSAYVNPIPYLHANTKTNVGSMDLFYDELRMKHNGKTLSIHTLYSLYTVYSTSVGHYIVKPKREFEQVVLGNPKQFVPQPRQGSFLVNVYRDPPARHSEVLEEEWGRFIENAVALCVANMEKLPAMP